MVGRGGGFFDIITISSTRTRTIRCFRRMSVSSVFLAVTRSTATPCSGATAPRQYWRGSRAASLPGRSRVRTAPVSEIPVTARRKRLLGILQLKAGVIGEQDAVEVEVIAAMVEDHAGAPFCIRVALGQTACYR